MVVNHICRELCQPIYEMLLLSLRVCRVLRDHVGQQAAGVICSGLNTCSLDEYMFPGCSCRE